MQLLTLHTLLQITSVGIVDTLDCEHSLHILTHSPKRQIEDLLPQLADLFDRQGMLFSQIDQIVVTNGVGSFTSTRLALTVVKTLGLLYHIPIFTVTTHEILYYSYLQLLNTKNSLNKKQKKQVEDKLPDEVWVVIPAEGYLPQFYLQIFSLSLTEAPIICEIQLLTVKEFRDLFDKRTLLSNKFTIVTNQSGLISDSSCVIDDFTNLHLIMMQIAQLKKAVSFNQVKPLYTKPLFFKTLKGNIIRE